jgi:hypothetical protein
MIGDDYDGDHHSMSMLVFEALLLALLALISVLLLVLCLLLC